MSGANRLPFSGPLYGLFQVLLVAVNIPATPATLRWPLLLATIYIAYYLIVKTSIGDLAADFGVGSGILTQLFTQLDFLFVTDPNTLIDHANPIPGKITEQPWPTRAKWTLNLYLNPRGVGWGHEPRNMPPRYPPGTPRWAFARAKLLEAALCGGVEFCLYVVNASNPAMTSGTKLSTAPLYWRALGAGCFGTQGLLRMRAMQCATAAVAVGSGLSSPERWPGLFGSPFDAWSVGRLWGRTWHKILRKPMIAFATLTTTKALRMPPKNGPIQSAVWVVALFLFVALIHIGGEYMATKRLMLGGTVKFFMLQPVAIIFEQTVGYLWTRRSPPPTKQKGHTTVPPLWVRCVGHIWVVLFYSWTLPFMMDPYAVGGIFIDERFDLRRLMHL
ncbi:hypothetical protein D9619_004301 [Psilocybe cf. subviscida]|uniref:Wax synthase domain-containing protein n=1 Tax=Psilocybe cf. subviscida TaxID=2480587 RepID=A0A8H5BSC4_9AGAR|nr:hypothetical protein D9619_004301 [Psilocybe cf. subviscida]